MDLSALPLPDLIPPEPRGLVRHPCAWRLACHVGSAGGLGWCSEKQSFLENKLCLTSANVSPLPDPALPSFSVESYSNQQQYFNCL